MGLFNKTKGKEEIKEEEVEDDEIVIPDLSLNAPGSEEKPASSKKDDDEEEDEEEVINRTIKEQMKAIKAERSISASDKGIKMRPDFWGILWPYIQDTHITDVDYNGSQLWLRDSEGNHFLAENQEGIDRSFVNSLTQRMANEVSKEFNTMNPLLEAETDELRISAIHESVAPNTGRSFCIRKTPKFSRITTISALRDEYATKEQLSFLVNCVRAHMNMAICGEPGVGKTEFCKYLSSFIPDNERVITIEDNLEWHYPSIHPDAECVEMKVIPGRFSYFDAIKACLRQNPKWIMLSEARGEEVIAYLQQLSTGVNGLTTLHCDNARKIPERLLNMCTTGENKERMENDIYNFLNVGVYLNRHKNSKGEECRFLDQISIFGVNHETGEKINRYIWSNMYPQFKSEEELSTLLPIEMKEKFQKKNLNSFLVSKDLKSDITKALKEEAYATPEKKQ